MQELFFFKKKAILISVVLILLSSGVIAEAMTETDEIMIARIAIFLIAGAAIYGLIHVSEVTTENNIKLGIAVPLGLISSIGIPESTILALIVFYKTMAYFLLIFPILSLVFWYVYNADWKSEDTEPENPNAVFVLFLFALFVEVLAKNYLLVSANVNAVLSVFMAALFFEEVARPKVKGSSYRKISKPSSIIILAILGVSLASPFILGLDVSAYTIAQPLSKNIFLVLLALPLWSIYALLLFLASIAGYASDEKKIPLLSKIMLIILLVVLILFSWPYANIALDDYKQTVQNYNDQHADEIIKMQKEIIEKGKTALKPLAFWPAFYECYLEETPLTLNKCIDDKMHPKNLTVGLIDPDSLKTEVVSIRLYDNLRRYPDSSNPENIVISGDIVAASRTDLKIDVSCESEDGISFETEPSVIEVKGSNSLINKRFPFTCKPLEKLKIGTNKFKVKLKFLDGKLEMSARKIDLFIEEGSLQSLKEDAINEWVNLKPELYNGYVSQNGQTSSETQELQEKYLLEQMFGTKLNSFYPDKQYLSLSKQGFIKVNIATIPEEILNNKVSKPPIIAISEGKKYPIKIGVENTEKLGKVSSIKSIVLDLPNFISPAKSCAAVEEEPFNVYLERHKFSIKEEYLKTNYSAIGSGEKQFIIPGLCLLNINIDPASITNFDLKDINPREVWVYVYYDYEIEEEFSLTIQK